MVLLVKVIQFI